MLMPLIGKTNSSCCRLDIGNERVNASHLTVCALICSVARCKCKIDTHFSFILFFAFSSNACVRCECVYGSVKIVYANNRVWPHRWQIHFHSLIIMTLCALMCIGASSLLDVVVNCRSNALTMTVNDREREKLPRSDDKSKQKHDRK